MLEDIKMSKKLTGNGMWESSRIILPEHREAINEYNRSLLKKQKPMLCEDEWELISQKINESYHTKKTISVVIFGEFEDRKVTGVVTNINPYSKKIRIEFDEGYEWIDFAEILSTELE
jgi:hypothetical protein